MIKIVSQGVLKRKTAMQMDNLSPLNKSGP